MHLSNHDSIVTRVIAPLLSFFQSFAASPSTFIASPYKKAVASVIETHSQQFVTKVEAIRGAEINSDMKNA